jgi:uncharacterized protein YhaN
MRIAQLQLMAYGPFRGLELDLSAPGIHVVFGRNEAGKSTTLRAINGLLYGIDVQTLDAHLHKPSDLRIGAVLTGNDGTRLRVVRRKGASKTLLDEAGQAIDDAVLQRMLHGVTQSTFENAFGLDLRRLHLGAKALLAGGGDVGGSLFDASVGGGGDARALLAQLEKEAESVYKPRGSALPLNEALKSFAEATKAIKETQRLPEAFVVQEKALDEGRKRRAELIAQRTELAARRAQIQRAKQRIPLERKRAAATAVLAELGDVARHATRIASLTSRLAAYERALIAHRDDTTASERLRDRVAEAARRAGVPADAKALRLDVRTQSRISKYLHERTELAARLESCRVQLATEERELARQRTSVPASRTVDPVALASLDRAVAQARKLGDLAARHATENARATRRRSDVEGKAVAAGLFEGPIEAFVALRPPAEPVLDELAARAAAAERLLSKKSDKVTELETRLATLEQELAEATGDFAPPTAAELRAARDVRDDAWTKLRDAGGAPSLAVSSAFERAVRDADELADRMIREADRVTTLARLRAQHATLVQQRAQATVERDRAAHERAAIDDEHRALWKAALAASAPPAALAGVASPSAGAAEPRLGLAEMRAWATKHAQIVEAFAAVREGEHDAAETARTMNAARDELSTALAAVDPDAGAVASGPATLVSLLDRAAAHLERIETTRRAVDDASRAITTLESKIEERLAVVARDEAALADARAKLAELVSPLGIADDADADEVTRALDALRELFGLEDQRADVESRAAAAGAEAREFDDEATRAATELAPDLCGLVAREIVAQLGARKDKAVAALAAIEDADAHLAELEHGVIPDEIAALAADADAANRALEEVDTRLLDLDDELTKETHAIARNELGLEQMRADTGAAEQAAQAQEALERIRSNVERFVRARVGSIILAREIERYREENQGPLLTKASELFARLTLGGFSGVRAGFNDKDKVVIKCVREGNVEVDVEGLSEGTRDQLYLSLRIASLLRYADLAEPMPLVLDDVLIQFDDERSRAALQIIAELSTRMQVLFFTHHARVVDLARAAVPAGLLTVHELASPSIVSVAATASAQS